MMYDLKELFLVLSISLCITSITAIAAISILNLEDSNKSIIELTDEQIIELYRSK
jgi:hypothetical protein